MKQISFAETTQTSIPFDSTLCELYMHIKDYRGYNLCVFPLARYAINGKSLSCRQFQEPTNESNSEILTIDGSFTYKWRFALEFLTYEFIKLMCLIYPIDSKINNL